MKFGIRIGLMVILLTAFILASRAPAIEIARKGAARAVIVVAADAPEPDRYTARELANFLGQVTGARFDMLSPEQLKDRKPESAGHAETRLLVGAGAARLADPAFSVNELAHDGLLIRTLGRDLILAGGPPHGTP
jgi:hypothetical protein